MNRREASQVVPQAAGRRPPSRGKRLAFRATALVLAWLVCEAAGYCGYWLWNGTPFSWSAYQRERMDRTSVVEGSGVLAQVHPYVGFVEEPRARSGVVRASDGAAIPVSEFGYVDDKTPIQAREPDKVVVAILGGSVACYFAVDGVETLEAALSRSPRFAGKRFVFVNLALFGYKQPQQLTTLAYLMSIGGQFDLVLNIDGFNEVALYELENAGQHVYPAFPRSWHARLGSNDPVLGLTRGRLLAVEEDRKQLAVGQSRAPWRYSVIWNLLWRYRDRRLEGEAYDMVQRYYKSESGQGPYVVTGPRRDFADRAELYDFLAAIWANSSAAIHDLCAANGVRYHHFLQPNQYVAGSKPMGDEEKAGTVYAEHPYRSGVETGYPLLKERGRGLKERGVRFHDLTRTFEDHPETIYRDTCCHVNQRGNELLGEAIARAILDDEPSPAAE